MKTSILKDPITVVRGRYLELPFHFYESYDKNTNTGIPKDLTDYVFICDFRYDPKDKDPVFTISNLGSPAGIIVDEGLINLILSEQDTANIRIKNDSKAFSNKYPFARLFMELKAIDPSGKKYSALLGTINCYENVTRSDDGI